MKKLNDIGYLQPGMIIVDGKGLEGVITGMTQIEGMGLLVEMDGNKNHTYMWDWDRVKDDVYVKDGTYS